MASQEYNLESVIIALLATNVALTQPIVHKDDDDAAEKDRIVVAVEPKMPSLKAYKENEKPSMWQAVARVTVRQATRDVAALETYLAAIDATMQASSPSGSVTTLAQSLFPASNVGAMTIDQSEEGSRHGEDVEIRMRERTYICRWARQSGD